MKKGKNTLSRSIVTATALTVSGAAASAMGLFNYNNLGAGEEVRTNLLERAEGRSLELKCGESASHADSAKKVSKDGKCGEGKCGEGKCGEGKKTDAKKKGVEKKTDAKKKK